MSFKVGDMVWHRFGIQVVIEELREDAALCRWDDLRGRSKSRWFKFRVLTKDVPMGFVWPPG